MVKVIENLQKIIISDDDVLIDADDNFTKITFYKDDFEELTVRALTTEGIQKFFLTKKQALEFADKLKEIYGEK